MILLDHGNIRWNRWANENEAGQNFDRSNPVKIAFWQKGLGLGLSLGQRESQYFDQPQLWAGKKKSEFRDGGFIKTIGFSIIMGLAIEIKWPFTLDLPIKNGDFP